MAAKKPDIVASKTEIDVTDLAALRNEAIETVKLLATPINFKGLVESGILASGRGAWYEVLQAELVPEHALQQVTETKQERRGDKRRTFFKFSKANAAAARLYEQMTGEPFKAP
jgi:hypothetical protein